MTFRQRYLHDERGLIVGWIVKLVVFLGIAGVLIVETSGVLFARGAATETATAAAGEAALALRTLGSRAQPEVEARKVAEDRDCKFIGLSYPENGKVTATVEREAKTFFVERIGPLKKYAVARVSHTSAYVGR